jgi:hypothetical protein
MQKETIHLPERGEIGYVVPLISHAPVLYWQQDESVALFSQRALTRLSGYPWTLFYSEKFHTQLH